jgi:insertion element IS1 protein InsB
MPFAIPISGKPINMSFLQYVIPAQQHRAVGKDSGETAHIERWNNTLRQRLARFTRQSLAFSKSDVMHEGCLRLFLHRFNCEIIL